MGLTFEQPWILALLVLALPLVWVSAHRLGLLETRVGRTAAALRSVVVVLVILALAGLAWLQHRDTLAVIFLVDASQSIGGLEEGSAGGSATARTFVKDAFEARPDGDMAGVVVFGQAPEIETIVRENPDAPLWASRPEAGGTDIEGSLRLAMASFPPGTHRRIVLLSDGVETRGNARQQAIVARELSVPIDTVVLPSGQTGPDVVAEVLAAPHRVEPDQPFDLRLQIRSPQATKGTLRLYRDDKLVGQTPIEVEAGLDVITVPQVLADPGLHRFRAVVEADIDSEPRNNEARVAVEVGGPPRILLLEGYEGGSDNLRATLEQAGFDVDLAGPEGLPDTLEGMAGYGVIALSDVSGVDLTRGQMQALERYVTDLGQGFVMLGGDQSFGPGGYFKTPVERVLPVRMTRRAQIQLPSQGILMVIDRSGSMGGFSGVSKMELAKEAAAAVVELLSPRDELGVAGFDGSASWVVPYDKLTDKDEALRRIGTMRAGGGTDIYNALRFAHRGIKDGDAAIRHIILLSDGISDASDLPGIVKDIRASKVTLTTVSIGADSDRYTMERLAKLGGGRYYETDRADAIPQIFTRETMLSSRSFLVEKPFVPEIVDPSEIMRGINALPKLDGHVATTAKPRATLALQTPDGNPLLVHWRRGLGRSLAFTSDAKGRWASAWLSQPDAFGPFWAQAMRWVAQTGASDTLALATALRGGTLTLTVDALDDGGWRDGAETRATVLTPDGRRQPVALRQVAPGRYRAEVDATEEGTWFVSVVQMADGKEIGRAVREIHRSHSPEFAPAHQGIPILQGLSASTGGVFRQTPDKVWAHPPTPIETPRPLAPWLLIAAAALWLIDIAQRRFEGFRAPGPAPAPTPAPSPTGAPRRANLPTPKPTGRDDIDPSDTKKDAPEPSDDEPAGYTSRLLDAKRRSRKK